MEFDDWDDWVSEKTNVPKKKPAVTGEIRETDSGPRDAYMIITDLMNQILDSVDDVDLENAIGIIRQIRKLLDENSCESKSISIRNYEIINLKSEEEIKREAPIRPDSTRDQSKKK